MSKSLLLLSTCGTSVLTNEADPQERRWLTEIANEATLSEKDEERLAELVANRRERLLTGDRRERRLSAELSSIDVVLARWAAIRIQHLLIHTDTATGKAAATVVAAILENDGQQVQLLTKGGLRTNDFPSFREALAELTIDIENWILGHREQGWTTLFNLTAGFKSVSAYLQMLGMLHADRCIFLFEGAPELMEIPRLPVKLAEIDEIRPHAKVFRRLEYGYPVLKNEIIGLPDALFLVDDDCVLRNTLGDVVWARVRKTLFREELLDPLSPKLTISDAVRRSFDKLKEEERRVQVNEALDALSAHLDRKRELSRSNTFKTLQGNPSPPATHELYVWSDGGAWRLFGHFEGDRFCADSLGPHL
jgi:putative CRISPR-associated protein (TIGR02619 family)